MNISSYTKTSPPMVKGQPRLNVARQSEHDRASASWDDYEANRAKNDAERRARNPAVILPARRGRAKSRVSGLGEFVRAEYAALRPPTAVEIAKAGAARVAKQRFQKDQAKKAYADNLRLYVRPVDDSRYFPHQSTREMAHRVRQMESVP